MPSPEMITVRSMAGARILLDDWIGSLHEWHGRATDAAVSLHRPSPRRMPPKETMTLRGIKRLPQAIKIIDAVIALTGEYRKQALRAEVAVAMQAIRAELAGYRAAQCEADLSAARSGGYLGSPEPAKSLKSHPERS